MRRVRLSDERVAELERISVSLSDARRAVNYKVQAENLAEALVEVIATGHDHNETGGVLITHEAWQACKDALANWEGAK